MFDSVDHLRNGPGYSDEVAHQGSVPKFIETIFKLPSLHSRDPAAQDGPDTSDLTEAFDWNQAPAAALTLAARGCLGNR